MSEVASLATPPLTRRQTKFTPANVRQITSLVERGKSREEIAEIIGVTTGTLQVTCSKLGISLHRPASDATNGLLRERRTRFHNGTPHPVTQDLEIRTLKSHIEQVQTAPEEKPMKEAQATILQEFPARQTDSATVASLAIKIRYKCGERTTESNVDQNLLGQIALEAEFRAMKIGDLVAKLLSITNNDLFELVLQDDGKSKPVSACG
jgi:hypothetical protein